MTNLVRCLCLALLLSLAAGQSIQVASVQGPGVRNGLEQIVQGIAGMQDAAQQKKSQFMDQAGNVYDAVLDAAGMATGMVRNRLGEVFDVTKMAGSWLYESAADYPEIAIQSGRDAFDSLRATATDIIDSGGEILQAAKDAIPEFPEKGEMLNRNQWISKMALNQMYMDRFFDTMNEQVGLLSDGMGAKYCRPPLLLPSIKHPDAQVRFPGGFKLKLHTTECQVESVSHVDGTEFTCRKPWIEFIKYPARYRSKYHSPVGFKGKECKFEVSHGEEDEIVLAVFDGKQDLDVESLLKQVDHAMLDAFNEDANDAGMEDFYRLLPELGDVEADVVQLLVDSMPDAAQIGEMAMNMPF